MAARRLTVASCFHARVPEVPPSTAMNARPGVSATRRLLLPGLMTAVMVLLLCGLGTWQVYRLQWKLAVLAQIAVAEQAPPVPPGGGGDSVRRRSR